MKILQVVEGWGTEFECVLFTGVPLDCHNFIEEHYQHEDVVASGQVKLISL